MSLRCNVGTITSYEISTGEILGGVTVSGSFDEILLTLPADDPLVSWIEGNYSSELYYVSSGGLPVAYTEEQVANKAAKPVFPARWSNEQMGWADVRSLAVLKTGALKLIDDFAGEARLRYITSVPGQAETYAKKEQQAREWASSSFSGDPPPFIQAEATALGVDPVVLANEIIAMADYWATNKGPQIEACRRKWKVNVESVVDVSSIDGLVELAKVELEAV